MRTLLAPPPIATGTAPIGGGNVDLDAARPAADAQSEQFDAVELSLDVRRSASDLDLPRHRGRQRDLGAPASPFERPVEAWIPEDDRLRVERRLRRVAREARAQHLVEIRHSAHHQLRRSVREREPARRCGSKCDGDIVSVVGNRQCIVRGHRLVLFCSNTVPSVERHSATGGRGIVKRCSRNRTAFVSGAILRSVTDPTPAVEELPEPPWRESRETPKTPLTRQAIVEAALRVLDRDGMDALSMRKVGEELGTGAASLYWHVRNKEELLQLVFEAVSRGGRPAHARSVAMAGAAP